LHPKCVHIRWIKRENLWVFKSVRGWWWHFLGFWNMSLNIGFVWWTWLVVFFCVKREKMHTNIFDLSNFLSQYGCNGVIKTPINYLVIDFILCCDLFFTIATRKSSRNLEEGDNIIFYDILLQPNSKGPLRGCRKIWSLKRK